MTQKQIKDQLKLLQKIQPDTEYAKASKFEILYAPTKQGKFVLFMESLSSTVSMGLVVLFFVFIAIGGVATILRNPIFPTFESVNQRSLTAEANTINTETQTKLEEVSYLEDSEDKSLARAKAKEEGIQSELKEEEIDQLLNEAKES